MEDRVLDRLVTLGFIKKYEYKESDKRNRNDNGTELEIASGAEEDSYLSLY